MNRLFLFGLVLFAFLPCSGSRRKDAKEYVAAAYEHTAIFIPFIQNASRAQALAIMMINVRVYREQARKAKAKMAQIIVFPEDGIYGMGYQWKNIQPFLEPIPDQSSLRTPWNPCLDPTRFTDTEILHELSCIALNFSIAVVANMGDTQVCTAADPNCPGDKHYQFNTDVVFDIDGTFLAKYHKQHLFYEESFNTPPKCEYVTFTVTFGVTFGVFTCFDMLYKSPAVDLVRKYGIRNIVFPTAWMKGFPIMLSVEFQQAWSRAFCVNLIAANQNQPIVSMWGSGIFSCGEAKAFVFNSTPTADQRLLIATLQDLNYPNEEDLTHFPRTADFDSTHAHDAPSDAHSIHGKRDKDGRTAHTFQSKIMNDIYNMVKLESEEGKLKVCQRGLCCALEYKTEKLLTENYALGVFRGSHDPEQYYLEVCVLVKCAGTADETCGTVVELASTVFGYFYLSGNFAPTATVYPELLTSGIKLVRKDALQVSGHTAMTTQGLQEPLVTAVLLGRDYSRDKF